jgi:membrane protein DedA with SNARE-associated domain
MRALAETVGGFEHSKVSYWQGKKNNVEIVVARCGAVGISRIRNALSRCYINQNGNVSIVGFTN